MTLVRTTYVDYIERKGELLARICGRSAGGERVVRYAEGTRPHFFVSERADVQDAVETVRVEKEMDDDWDPVEITRDGYEMYNDRPVQKVVVEHPDDVDRLRDQFDVKGEADIPYYRRLTMDYDLAGYIDVPEHKTRCHISDIDRDIDPTDVDSVDPRALIADIEVEVKPGQSFEEMQEEAENRVIALTFYDTGREDYWIGVVDPDDSVEPIDVRSHLEDHWDDHDLKDQMTDADIRLVQAQTEVDLLTAFVNEVSERSVDLLAGWNFVDFDAPYLLDRLTLLEKADMLPDEIGVNSLSQISVVQRWKGNRAITGTPSFDQMDAYCEKMSFHEWRSKRLDYVAEEEIGVGKVDHPGIMDDYENNRSRLTAYNLLDVQLCVALSEKFGIEEFFYELADMAGIQISDTFSELRLVDGYMISRRESDEVLPTQEEKEIKTPAGGLVLAPSDGIQDYVAAFDLKSLYPSAMVSANISRETMTTDPSQADIVVPSMPAKEMDVGGRITEEDINWDWSEGSDTDRGWAFTLDREGMLPKYCRELFRDRAAKKALRNQYDPDDPEYDVYDRQQAAVKVIMNSFYGVSNSPYYRLAKDGVGDAITAMGRYVLWRGSEICRELGYEVIYGDTDSVFIQLADSDEDVDREDLLERGREIEAELNDRMTKVADDIGIPDDGHPYIEGTDLHGTDRHAFHFEFEKLYSRFFQAGSKKRYAGDIIWKEGKNVDKLDVVGFESQRADVPEITATVQEKAIKLVLDGAEFSEVSDLVRGNIEAIKDGDVDLKNIGVPKALKKNVSEYGNLPRARSARFSNEYLDADFGQGDTPWMYYVERTPISVPDTDVMALEWHADIPDDYVIDWDKTVEKAFESALTPILSEAGWSFDEVRSGRLNQSVGDDGLMNYDGDPFSGTTSSTASEPSDDDDDDDMGALAW